MLEEIGHGFLASKQKWRLLQNLQRRWIKCKIWCRRVREITWKLENEGKTDILLACMKDQQRMHATVSLKLVSLPDSFEIDERDLWNIPPAVGVGQSFPDIESFLFGVLPKLLKKLNVVSTSRFLLNSNTVRFHGFGYWSKAAMQ